MAALLGVATLLALSAMIVGAGEWLLRRDGWQPWAVHDPGIRVSPGGRVVQQHPTLGYTHLAGRYEVTLGDGFSFVMTHGPDTLRITSPGDTAGADGRPEIWILGCSATHGWSLNDAETYPWVLQAMLPQYHVVNFGVSGYGTLHSLIQFREALAVPRPRPAIVVLAYGDFHDARNTFARQRRKEVVPWNRLGPLSQPVARLQADGSLVIGMAAAEYRPWPLMNHLALVNKLESSYNELEVRALGSHEVSEKLMLDIATLARDNGARFVLAGIWNGRLTADMLAFAAQRGIQTVDISVDTSLPENNNLPHDIHPSALANRRYAEKLGAVLGQVLPVAATRPDSLPSLPAARPTEGGR
jgi:hypothetical protein